MNGVRTARLRVRWLAAVAFLSFTGCSGLMTSVGGGMTPELEQGGVAAVAEILEIWDTGWTINDNPVIGMKVWVEPGDRPAFEATIDKTTISRIAIPQFQPGNRIPVRFDPQNPALVAVDPGGGSEISAAPSSGNPFRDRFERAELVGASFLPPPSEPKLFLGTGDMTGDFQTLLQNGYALLGGSGVRNARDPELALEQGREIGAALVVVYGHFVSPPGTALELLPFPRRAAASGAAGVSANRYVSGTVGPDDQFATYWGETRPAILGIVSRPLNVEEQKRFGRRDGIVVETVSSGSPAEAAGIAVGDVVVAIEGRSLEDVRAVPAIVTSLAGQEVRIELLRDGRPMAVTATLGPASP